MMLKLILVFSLQLFVVSAWADNLKTFNHLKCGNGMMEIQSIMGKGEEPVIEMQNLKFLGGINYKYKFTGVPGEKIFNADCLNNGDSYYFDLTISNLGNCKICEWHDFYTVHGVYLGSSKWVASATGIVRKMLSRNNLDSIAKAIRKNGISVD